MREGWTYKRLGDICTIERGGSPRPIDAFITTEDNGLNWIKIGDAVEGSKYISSTKEKIKPEGLKKTRFVHKGDFILSNSMSFGKPYILNIDGCIHDGWLVIHDGNDTFDKSFLYYLLGCPNMYKEFKRLAVGGVVNNLNSKVVRDVIVPVPPLQEQERIVAELDLLTEIIDKQKQQLKELDTLAQSIFYDMFGSPDANEKEWIMKSLAEIGTIVSGSTPSTSDESNWDGDVNWVTPAELGVQLFYGETRRKITSKAAKSLTIMPIGTLLMSSRAPIGKLAITSVPMCCNQGFKNIVCGNNVNNIYLYYCLMLNINSIKAMGRGATFKEVSKQAVSSFEIMLPPMNLQELFAQKILSIESQKKSINRSIAESQKLFDYTMDKYFG